MRLLSLRLQDFRNIALAAIDVGGGNAFFCGRNGQGKTNLLEAVGFATALRSFRTNDARLLMRTGAREARVIGRWRDAAGVESELEFRLRARGKTAEHDGRRIVRLADLIGVFPTVVFSSSDNELVRGAPAQRRRWLDLVISSADANYLRRLQRYHRTLDERNRLLRENDSTTAEMRAFERVMAPLAAEIVEIRGRVLGRLEALYREVHDGFSADSERPGLRYKPDSSENDTDVWLELWDNGRERDRVLQATQRGPHRDDFEFRFDDNAARGRVSEGEERGLVLALRFAQARWVRERTGTAPVLLADDVLGELDSERRERFWTGLDPDWQVLATGTEMPEGLDESRWRIFQVSDGTFRSS